MSSNGSPVSVATDPNRALLEEYNDLMMRQMEKALEEYNGLMKREMEKALDEKLEPLKRQMEETTQELSRLNKRTGILVEEKARTVSTD
jgi:polyhydroxyalkanoate synthesis regulator phasin